jgi:hypothetical protein
MTPLAASERACAYLTAHVRRAAGARWLQGARVPPIECEVTSDPVRLFATKRLCKIEDAVSKGLVAWAHGQRDVVLLERVPAPREVLALQARGARCVSILADDARTTPHADGLAFALHDLCHMEKFFCEEHHRGQVGFFRLVDRAMSRDAWSDLERGFDDAWIADRDHVVADMNGSAIFLFAALKMKLKMAVRRRLARGRGVEAAAHGPLDELETRAFVDSLEVLFDVLAIEGAMRDAARVVSTRRDEADAACVLLDALEEMGRVDDRA